MRIALAIAAAALLAASGPAEAKKPAKPCSKKGSKTVASSKSVRVYKVKNGQGDFNLVGCLRSNNKRQTLARGYEDGYVTSGKFGHVTLAGRFVAWEYTAYDISCKAGCPPDYNPTTVHLSIRDLRERTTEHVDGDVASKGRLVLTMGGSIAWTQQGASEIEVDAFDVVGREQLDHGQIPPGSLKLSGKVASWTNAGAPQSATLASRH
jgi:hypothetical protein